MVKSKYNGSVDEGQLEAVEGGWRRVEGQLRAVVKPIDHDSLTWSSPVLLLMLGTTAIWKIPKTYLLVYFRTV